MSMRRARKAPSERPARGLRLEAIAGLLRAQRIHTQAELEVRLRRRGHRVTQATLSRDLRDLGVARRPDAGGGSVYALPAEPRLAGHAVRSALTGFLGMSFSGNLAVVKTLPGYAASVALAFDGAAVDGLLGTVAGDDTVLMVAAEGVSRATLKRAIVGRLPELEGRIG